MKRRRRARRFLIEKKLFFLIWIKTYYNSIFHSSLSSPGEIPY